MGKDRNERRAEEVVARKAQRKDARRALRDSKSGAPRTLSRRRLLWLLGGGALCAGIVASTQQSDDWSFLERDYDSLVKKYDAFDAVDVEREFIPLDTDIELLDGPRRDEIITSLESSVDQGIARHGYDPSATYSFTITIQRWSNTAERQKLFCIITQHSVDYKRPA